MEQRCKLLKIKPTGIDGKCRHCKKLYEGTCPYPGSKSVHVMRFDNIICKQFGVLPQFRNLYKREIERTPQEKAMRKEAAQVLCGMRRVHNKLRVTGETMNAGMAAAMKQFVRFCREEL